jgi:peptide chain release factor 2
LELVTLSDSDADADLLGEIQGGLEGFQKRLSAFDRQALFRHQDDQRGAILTIQSGAGGVDAMDWAQQLERMYLKYMENEGLSASITDRLEGGSAGIHYSEIEVRGLYAYGKLRSERGVHRIQHVSAFDANGKKQTSFAAVDVMPLFPATVVEILEKDLDFDTFCSGGPGGQNVNKVASAVRVRHLPTGLIVKCQNHRSQHENKRTALGILASKLRQREEDNKERRPKLEASFGHQIRTYVLEPYQLVKDHRTGCETSNAKSVLDGDLVSFREAFLMAS